MGRRTRTTRVDCAHAGCREVGFFEYESRAELARICKDMSGWKCLRHTGNETMSRESLERRRTLVVVRDQHGHAYWTTGERKESGFQHGPGFRVYAEDFPDGARLEVTARVVLPTIPQEGSRDE